MNGAVLSIAAAAMLSACASSPSKLAASTGPHADYSHLSCRQIASEITLIERAYTSASRPDRSVREGETAQAYLFPASLGMAPPPAVSAKLEARLGDLRRASRAKRCASAWRSYEAATA
jgi:hypothetical protein